VPAMSPRRPEPLTQRQRQLVERHLPLAGKLVAALRRRVPRHADLDNLSGEAHLALVRAARSWNGTGSFAAYASVCIRNALAGACGAAARATCESLDEGVIEERAAADTAADAIALADYRAASASLSSHDRNAVALAAAGFRPRDQAALLGVPLGTVTQRLFRARRRLVPQLAG
jgi:RNA polymerase sigma factor (sigma-70 family)